MSKALSYIAPVAGAILGSVIAPGVGTAIGASLGSGGYNYSQTHDIGSALANAAGTYAGSSIGGSLLGNLGTVGGSLNSVLGSTAGGAASGALGSLAGTSIGSILGGSVGGDLASSLVPQKSANNVGQGVNYTPPPFKPTRAADMSAPLSIQGLGSLTSDQQSSNIASQGVYGGGQGSGENSYFLNLINHKLVDNSGKVDQGFGDITPIENSYLAQLGLGNKKNPTDLLQAISGWRS